MKKNNINIDDISTIEDLLSHFTFEDIKNALKDKYYFNINKYKNNFYNYMSWFFLTPYEAVFKKAQKHYVVISIFNFDQYYMALYNEIKLNEFSQNELNELKAIVAKEFPSILFDESMYIALTANRLTPPWDAQFHLLTQSSDSLINFIKELSAPED